MNMPEHKNPVMASPCENYEHLIESQLFFSEYD